MAFQPRFKIGDKVKYIGGHKHFTAIFSLVGKVGRILRVFGPNYRFVEFSYEVDFGKCAVDFGDTSTCYEMFESELELEKRKMMIYRREVDV